MTDETIPEGYEKTICEHSGVEILSKKKPEETGEHVCEHSGAVIPAKG